MNLALVLKRGRINTWHAFKRRATEAKLQKDVVPRGPNWDLTVWERQQDYFQACFLRPTEAFGGLACICNVYTLCRSTTCLALLS